MNPVEILQHHCPLCTIISNPLEFSTHSMVNIPGKAQVERNLRGVNQDKQPPTADAKTRLFSNISTSPTSINITPGGRAVAKVHMYLHNADRAIHYRMKDCPNVSCSLKIQSNGTNEPNSIWSRCPLSYINISVTGHMRHLLHHYLSNFNQFVWIKLCHKVYGVSAFKNCIIMPGQLEAPFLSESHGMSCTHTYVHTY